MIKLDLINYNSKQETIVCLPDIVESKDFLEQLYKESINVILIIRSCWLATTQVKGSFAYITFEPTDCSEEIEKLVLQKIQEINSIINPNKLKIKSFICFAEKNIEMMARMESNWFDDPSQIQQALSFRDKLLMRKIAEKSGISQPQYARADDDDKIYEMRNYQSGGLWNFIAKPRSEWCSYGVEFFESFDDIKKWKSQLSKATLEDYLIETFIQGTLFHVDGIVRDGKTIKNYCFRYGIPLGLIFKMESFPYFSDSSISTSDPFFQKLADENNKLISAFGLKTGMTHSEFFLEEKTNRIFFCETAKRPPGAGVIKMHKILSGQSSMAIFAQSLISDSQLLLGQQKGSVGVIFFYQHEGNVPDIFNWKDNEIIDREVFKYENQNNSSIDFLKSSGRIYIQTDEDLKLEILMKKFIERYKFEMEK
jgi:hypothetical protein